MKNLFYILLPLLFVATMFSSCEKKLPLIASLKYSGDLRVGEKLTFSNQENFSARFYWNFGDGDTETFCCHNGGRYKTYNVAGTYTVTLTITRDQETVSTSQNIIIAP